MTGYSVEHCQDCRFWHNKCSLYGTVFYYLCDDSQLVEEYMEFSALTNSVLTKNDELKKLILENPDLPIVVEVNPDVVCDDDRSWIAPCVSCRVGEVLDCEQDINPEITYFDRDDFEEDVAEYLYDKRTCDFPEPQWFKAEVDKILKEYEPYWKKCIIIYATV